MKVVAHTFSLVLILVGGSCSKRDEAAKSAGSGSAISVSGSGSAMAGNTTVAMGSDSDAGAASAGDGSVGSGVAGRLNTMAERDGLLLADTVGGDVTLTLDGGKTEQLADGTIVKVMGQGDFESVRVDAGGKQGRIKTSHIVMEEDIQRAPNGEFAVVTPEITCADLCSAAVWLVRGMTERWSVFDSAVHATAAWHPQGTHVAIGGDGQFVVLELPAAALLYESDTYSAPAYAPDGTLYVRDETFGIFTFTDGKAKKVSKGRKPPQMEGEFAPVPGPVMFGPDGKLKIEN